MARQIVSELEDVAVSKSKNEGITLKEFSQLTMRYRGLLAPAFQIQDSIRNRVGGSYFWGRASEKRLKLTDGKYMPIETLIFIAVNADDSDRALGEVRRASKFNDSEAVAFLQAHGGATIHSRQQQHMVKAKVAPSPL